jgi:hypothetical protein
MASKPKLYQWRITQIRERGRFIGTVQAPDAEAAIKAAIKEFEIREPEQRKRLIAQRVG